MNRAAKRDVLTAIEAGLDVMHGHAANSDTHADRRAMKIIDADLDAIHAGDAPRAMSSKPRAKRRAVNPTRADLDDVSPRRLSDYEPTIPTTLGACADALYALREQRLAIEKQVEAFKSLETAIREHLINTLPKNDATGTSGNVAHAQIKTKRIPQVEDWPALYKYVKRTGEFELLQRRLANDAVAERWEAGKEVPGVGAFNTVTVSVTKL